MNSAFWFQQTLHCSAWWSCSSSPSLLLFRAFRRAAAKRETLKLLRTLRSNLKTLQVCLNCKKNRIICFYLIRWIEPVTCARRACNDLETLAQLGWRYLPLVSNSSDVASCASSISLQKNVVIPSSASEIEASNPESIKDVSSFSLSASSFSWLLTATRQQRSRILKLCENYMSMHLRLNFLCCIPQFHCIALLCYQPAPSKHWAAIAVLVGAAYPTHNAHALFCLTGTWVAAEPCHWLISIPRPQG